MRDAYVASDTVSRDVGLRKPYAASMSPLISAAQRALTRSLTAASLTSGGVSFVSPPPTAAQPAIPSNANHHTSPRHFSQLCNIIRIALAKCLQAPCANRRGPPPPSREN